MSPADGRIHARDWSLLVGLSILWGGSFFLVGVVLKELPPLTLVLLRLVVATMILLPLLRLSRIEFPRDLAGWLPFCAMSFFNNVLPFSLIAIGQTYIAAGLASILNATTPMFTVLVMALAGEESFIARRLAGVVAGLIGVVILRGGLGAATAGQSLGIVLVLVATLSYAVSALVARRYLHGSPPLATATFQMMASSAMMMIVAGVLEQPWRLALPSTTTWLAVIGLGSLSTALAYLVFFQIVRRSGASNVMLVTLLIPVTAILLGYLVLGENISTREVAGALVIGSALLLIDGRVVALLRRRFAVS
jgi:drug/metabolite transporter (DMT)-like permease